MRAFSVSVYTHTHHPPSVQCVHIDTGIYLPIVCAGPYMHARTCNICYFAKIATYCNVEFWKAAVMPPLLLSGIAIVYLYEVKILVWT